MKRLQLPKNKLARIAINIAFIVIWPLVANQIKWFLNGISFVPYIYHFQLGCGITNYEICGITSLFYHLITYVLPMILVTRYIWFGRIRPRPRITTSMDD